MKNLVYLKVSTINITASHVFQKNKKQKKAKQNQKLIVEWGLSLCKNGMHIWYVIIFDSDLICCKKCNIADLLLICHQFQTTQIS